jgi:hypothetical protein
LNVNFNGKQLIETLVDQKFRVLFTVIEKKNREITRKAWSTRIWQKNNYFSLQKKPVFTGKWM